MSVLNPGVYTALYKTRPRVRVVNPGVPLEGFYQPDPLRGGIDLRIVRRGETYLADCPFCVDAGMRLAVNHRFGVYDPATGRDGINLWKCYNEECQADPGHRKKMYETLTGPLAGGFRVRVPDVAQVSATDLEPAEFPGILVPVDALDPNHPTAVYLDGRGFDRAELFAVWGVAHAEHVPARSRGAMSQGRVIVPVTVRGVTVGWQARYAGELDWKPAGVPKYLTYFPKSRVVYGADQAADPAAAVVALFEGCTDVWRYGPGGVSCLGKDVSPDQARLLAALAAGRPVVAVPDYDDPESEAKLFDGLAAVVAAGHTGPVGVCPLPAGTDPADHPRPRLRAMIAAAARSAIR